MAPPLNSTIYITNKAIMYQHSAHELEIIHVYLVLPFAVLYRIKFFICITNGHYLSACQIWQCCYNIGYYGNIDR
jgi:hypothetical protein